MTLSRTSCRSSQTLTIHLVLNFLWQGISVQGSSVVLLEVSSLSRLGMIWQESLQAFLQFLTAYGISPVLGLTCGSIRNTWLNHGSMAKMSKKNWISYSSSFCSKFDSLRTSVLSWECCGTLIQSQGKNVSRIIRSARSHGLSATNVQRRRVGTHFHLQNYICVPSEVIPPSSGLRYRYDCSCRAPCHRSEWCG